MSDVIVVHKGRKTVIPVSLGFDVSGEVITSQIRSLPDQSSTLIATWTVAFLTDGTDGELILSLDDSVTVNIKETSGYMDLKRMSAGEPLSVFDKPLEVELRGTVTV